MEPETSDKDKMCPVLVKRGIIVLYISLLFSLQRVIVAVDAIKDPNINRIIILISVPLIALSAFLIYMIYKGRSWARTTFLVLFIVGIVLNIDDMILWYYTIPVLLKIYFLEIVAVIIGLVMVLSSSNSEWFRE